jgi:hypothetical protein
VNFFLGHTALQRLPSVVSRPGSILLKGTWLGKTMRGWLTSSCSAARSSHFPVGRLFVRTQ